MDMLMAAYPSFVETFEPTVANRHNKTKNTREDTSNEKVNDDFCGRYSVNDSMSDGTSGHAQGNNADWKHEPIAVLGRSDTRWRW
jgi:hypothetical protein